jgi:hypothetical protein
LNPFKEPGKKRPEAKIQAAIIRELRYRGWLVKETHGSMFQSGFPDLFCYHRNYGLRWVECKNAKAYRFTPAQMEWFPQFAAVQCGIWVLTGADEDELKKLFGPPNWMYYIKGMGWDAGR